MTFLNKRIFFLLFLSVSILGTSCGGKKNLTSEEAGNNLIAAYKPDMVMSMAIGDMVEKSGIKGGDAIPWAFRQIFSDQLDYITKEEKFGVSLKGKTIITINNTADGKFDKALMIVNLTDPETFAAEIKVETEIEPQERSGYNYVVTDDNTFCISWYETFAVFTFTAEGKNKEQAEAMLDDVMAKAIEKGDPGEEYSKVLEEKSDYSVLFHYGTFMNMADEYSESEDDKKLAGKLREFYGNSYSIYSVNFEVDKITGKMLNFFDGEAKTRIEAMSAKGVDPSFMKFLGNEDLFGFGTFSCKPDEAMTFLEDIAADKDDNFSRLEEQTGLNLNEWTAGFSGEFAVAFAGITKKERSYTYYDEAGKEVEEKYTSDIPVVNFTVGLEGNLIQTVFDTLSTFEKMDGYFKKEEGYFTIIDNKLFISTDAEQVKYLVANGSFPEFKQRSGKNKSSDEMTYGYFDFKKFKEILPANDDATNAILDFDFMTVSGNMNEIVFELNLIPSGKNSLYIITKGYFDIFMSSSMGKIL